MKKFVRSFETKKFGKISRENPNTKLLRKILLKKLFEAKTSE
jgi:hypothetical protein